MLQSLHIQNYAIIEELELEFSEGLTIVTGETGAGKSILVGALSLLTGQRAEPLVLRDKTKKCIVEAAFYIKGIDLKGFFGNHELDYNDNTLIRREISPEGKSRAFINDTPVNLAQLKEIGAKLVDIHSQHETLLLADSNFQLSVIDAFARHNSLLQDYRKKFKEWKKDEQLLTELSATENQMKKDLDYFQFQHNELAESRLIAGEQTSLEKESEEFVHSEEIKINLQNAIAILIEKEHNIFAGINEVKRSLEQASRYKQSLKEVIARIYSAGIELKDILSGLETANDSVQYDPQRLEEINNRLDLIYRLQKKHGVQTAEQLLELQQSLEIKIKGISSLGEEIASLQKKTGEELKKLVEMAMKISDGRKKAIPAFTGMVHRFLHQLAMPHALVKVEQKIFQDNKMPQETGMEDILFLFLPNKGGEFKELSRIASGGELSRLMLSIKASVAKLMSLPVIILDEIDSGVSGDVADKLGNILKAMSGNMQVIAITHLPQIASKADRHLLVFKKTGTKTTHAFIKALDEKERVTEIAKMLSGEEISEEAIENAKVLLS